MSRLFGEEVAEYGGDTSPSSVEEAVVAVEGQSNTLSDPSSTTPLAAVQREQSVVPQTRAVVKPKQKREKIELTSSSAESKVGEQGLENKPVDVLLLQGPCSFVRGVWTGWVNGFDRRRAYNSR
ncbi:unnamed protein product [Phytophthora lilii]|uniref:Unnamed protein product n=1 Tax=Phytophthora lilii TaxID=2077276 RepID=A0A9W7D8C5_9STRA|nr:unnamed protein product [Phytophthora lilii]